MHQRSMASGHAGLNNNMFYMDKKMNMLGNTRKTVEDIVNAIW